LSRIKVIATTHSPLLVDKLSLDDLIVAEKVQGETRFARASSKKKLQKPLSRKEAKSGTSLVLGGLSAS
jgi:hypothetical protein